MLGAGDSPHRIALDHLPDGFDNIKEGVADVCGVSSDSISHGVVAGLVLGFVRGRGASAVCC